MRHARTLLLLAAVVLTACSDDENCGDTVASRTNPSTDFATIQTFAVLPASEYPGDVPADLPENFREDLDFVNGQVRAQLLNRGLTEVDRAASPDVLIFSAGASESDTGVVWECVPGWAWWGWTFIWDSCAWLEPIPVTYGVGTIVTGLADPVAEEIVFGGVMQGVLYCGDPEERIASGVARIFQDYPIPPMGM